MNRKTKQGVTVSSCAAALSLLAIIFIPSVQKEPTPPPPVAPVSASTAEDGAIPQHKPNPVPVGEKTATVEPHNTHATEIDSEPPAHSGGTGITTPTQPPSDKPTPAPVTPKTPQPPSDKPTHAPVTPKTPQPPASAEPKMGDTRIVDGQKQVYFLGFGWIDDNDTPNEVYHAEDMYENGNKVGIMGDGTFVDGDGDINKMVGTMD